MFNYKFNKSFFKSFIRIAIGVINKKKIIPIIIGAVIFDKTIPNLNHIIFKGFKIFESLKPRIKKNNEIINDHIFIF